jgi:hypothetical protein
MGYHVKFGQDITVRAEGKDRGLKLKRNFGEDYSIESIRSRILAQTRPEPRTIPAKPPPKKMRFKGTFHNIRRTTGLRALYYYYLYRMGILPRKRVPNPKRVYFQFREDIRHIQNISREARLLVKHSIDTDRQLTAHKDGLTSKINTLYDQRKKLRNRVRSVHDDEKLNEIKSEISALSDQMKELRREVRLCENIDTRSTDMKNKLDRAREEAEKSKEKEIAKNAQFSRRR